MGLHAAVGGSIIWQVEINEYARSILKKRFLGANRDVSDICHASAKNLEPVDLICAGFPCQGISVAGKRSGLEDSRSGLWFELLRVCGEVRPRFIVLENSPAIRTNGLRTVLQGLASLGYDAVWGNFTAASVGAPHRRNRWFCVAYLPDAIRDQLRIQPRRGDRENGTHSPEPVWPGTQGTPPDAHSPRKLQQKRVHQKIGRWSGDRSGWSTEPGVCGVAHGIPNRMDRLRCLGNAVVPEWARWVGSIVGELGGWS